MTTREIGRAVEDIARSVDLAPSQILTPEARQALDELMAEELRRRGVEAHA